jgi:hypothetical protein
MVRQNDRYRESAPEGRYSRLDVAADLEQARTTLLGLAADVDRHVTVAMLAEALVQIERIGPPVSGEAWEAYLAVERVAAPHNPRSSDLHGGQPGHRQP